MIGTLLINLKVFKELSHPRFLKFHYRKLNYHEEFKRSLENPNDFWGSESQSIHWMKKWDKVLDASKLHAPKWFVGGELNMSYNCLDRHVNDGYGDHLAVIYDSPITGLIQKMTYKQLLEQVEKLAAVFVKYGVEKGDRILIYLPMVPQTLITMLASCRIGAVHSLVFGGFAAKELSVRIKHAEPKIVVTSNVGVEPSRIINYKAYVDEAIELSGFQPKHCIVYNRPGHKKANMVADRDLEWEEEIHEIQQGQQAVPVDSNHPLYILYTSGTTGAPKGIVRPTGGYAVALKYSMPNLYGIDPGEVWWAASDFGWVVGHSFICYGPLLHRCTTIIYEGKPVGTPDTSQYFRVLAWHNPVSMFVAPTALRAIRREDSQAIHSKRYKYPHFRSLFLAGEHCDVETLHWCQKIFQVPVLDNWWQTETGWPITCPSAGLETRHSLEPPPGSAGRPVPGYDVQVVDSESKKRLKTSELGRIVVKLPLPPGNTSGFYRRSDEDFYETYFKMFPGYYDTMDAGTILEHGHVMVMARDDDVINVAGHRLSSGALEEACLEHPDIVECAIIGLNDSLKGQVPLGLLVPDNNSVKTNEELIKETLDLVRERIGAVASFKHALVVHRLPKTRSGKISRKAIADMANGKPFKVPVTLEDPTVFDPIYNAFIEIGLKPSQPDNQ